MSAILGMLNTRGDTFPVDTGLEMMKKISKYPADKVETWHGTFSFLGCHHQYSTPVSSKEVLPYFDSEANLVITADAIIDNRRELLRAFNIGIADGEQFPDGMLILMAYKKWGELCPRYIIGDYAFCIIDIKNKKVVCGRDHVGKRTLYYTLQDTLFTACTLRSPLLLLQGRNMKLNEQWIADFLAIPSVMHHLDPELTVYSNIFELLPAHVLVADASGIKTIKYWEPLNLPELKLKTDEEYDEAFREVLFEAVRCRTESIGQVGIKMSGGLDSGSVGCIAAMQMQEWGERLKAYTSIPMKGYQSNLNARYIADESPYVDAIVSQYNNIDIKYCRTEGIDSYSKIDHYLEIYEQPYKVIENLHWSDNIAEIAASDGCRVLLSGQFGNCTISFGDFHVQLYTLLRKGNLASFLREFNDYCCLHGYGRKTMAKNVAKKLIPFFRSNPTSMGAASMWHSFSPLHPDMAKKYNTEQRLEKGGYGRATERNYTLQQYRKFILDSHMLSQAATMETHCSLAHCLAMRDPSRDKRIFEFCFSLPGDQFVRNGQERLILRRALKGILPDKVRLNSSVKGVQSADWIQRLQPQWNRILGEIKDNVYNKEMKEILDIDSIIKVLECNKNIQSEHINTYDVRRLIICLIFNRFVSEFSSMKSIDSNS